MLRINFPKEISAWWWFLISGFGLGAGFVFPYLWWLAIPAIAAFLKAVKAANSFKVSFFGGWLAFAIKMSFSLGWIFTTYPIKWINLDLGVAELGIIGFYWLTLALAVGLSGGVLAAALYYLSKNTTWPVIFTGTVLWLPTEILGSIFFTTFTLGAGGYISTQFSFGFTGYHLVEQPFLFLLASWGGVYILSITAVILGAGLYYLLQRENLSIRTKWGVAAVSTFLVLTSFIPYEPEPSQGETKVAIIDTDFGGEEFWSLENRGEAKHKALEEALTAALATEADYVVMSEDSPIGEPSLSLAQNKELFELRYKNPRAVVMGVWTIPTGLHETALRATVFDGKQNNIYAVDKQLLVPQGEFMPYFYLKILNLLGFNEATAGISAALAYKPGPKVSQANWPSHIPGFIFCFSDTSPLAIRRLLRERDMPFVAHSISYAWFHSHESLRFQFSNMLKVQARFNNIDIISAGNMTSGALYTKDGYRIEPVPVATGERWRVSVFEIDSRL